MHWCIQDLHTGLSKGYGFVRMLDKDSIDAALKQRNQLIGQFNVRCYVSVLVITCTRGC